MWYVHCLSKVLHYCTDNCNIQTLNHCRISNNIYLHFPRHLLRYSNSPLPGRCNNQYRIVAHFHSMAAAGIALVIISLGTIFYQTRSSRVLQSATLHKSCCAAIRTTKSCGKTGTEDQLWQDWHWGPVVVRSVLRTSCSGTSTNNHLWRDECGLRLSSGL